MKFNSLKYYCDFVRLPIIVIIIVGIIFINWIGYIVFKHNQSNKAENIKQEQENRKQAGLTQNNERVSSLNLNSTVPLNNLPEDISSAIVSNYFESFKFNNKFRTDVDQKTVDQKTFVILPESYYFAENKGEAEFYLPGGKGITLTSETYKYAKDRNHVYFMGEILLNADPATFVLLDLDKSGLYAKDKDHVWMWFNRDFVNSVDLSTFTILSETYGYAKDKNHVYLLGKILPNTDPATFVLLDKFGRYAKDKDHVYMGFNEAFVNNVDIPTFTVLDDHWSKDKNQAYYTPTVGSQKTIIIKADLETFSFNPLAKYIAQDKNNIFFFYKKENNEGKILTDVEPSAFVVIDDNLSKSKNYVFLSGEMVGGVDSSTFVFLANLDYAEIFRDSNNLYMARIFSEDSGSSIEKITPPDIDISTLKHIKGSYFRDKNNVYTLYSQDFILIDKANPDNFEASFVDNIGVCASAEMSVAYYAKDNDYVYCGTNVVNGADPVTFEYIGGYDEGFEMPLSSGIGKDKNCIYRRGEKLLDSAGICIKPVNCTTNSLANNPLSCGISGAWGEFQIKN